MNQEQQIIIDDLAPLKLVVAGPGAGKTRLLVAAIAKTLETLAAERVLVMTYTRAAAKEIQDRILAEADSAFGGSGVLGYCGTLHGFMLQLVRQHHRKLLLPATLNVADDVLVEETLKEVMREMGIKTPMKRMYLDQFAGSREALAWVETKRRLRDSGLLPFDAILEYGLTLIRMLEPSEWPYEALFVDEMQDAADIDADIYEAMPCGIKFIVGDPDQSIFKFRGGNPERMVRMVNLADNPEWKPFTLQTNYRSGRSICAAANRLIAHNTGRIEKQMQAATEDFGEVAVHTCATPAAELNYVLGQICLLVNISDVAVLCRTNFEVHMFAEFLKANGVPVRETRRVQDPEDWKLAKLLLAVAACPWNDVAVRACIMAKEGPEAAAKLQREAAKRMIPLGGLYFGDQTEIGLLMEFCDVSAASIDRVNRAAIELGGDITDSDLLLYFAREQEEQVTEGAGVTCCTIHAAKGREWETVCIVGCEEGTLPSSKFGSEIEEERRLMFVALTRAKRQVFVTHCVERPQYRGQNVPPGPLQKREPSRFIAEMESR